MKYTIFVFIFALSILNCTKDNNPFAPNNGVWQKVGSPQGLRVEQFSFNSKGGIFITTWWHPHEYLEGAAQYRIERSTDNGMNWLSILQTGWPVYIAIDPNDYIFAGSFGFKVKRSINNGDSWDTIIDTLPVSFIHTIAISPEGYVYLGANGGNYRSKDNGNSWEKLTLEYQAKAFLFLENGIILSGVSSGHFPNPPQYMYRSANNGETWEQVLLAEYTFGWSMAVNQNGTVFAATADYDNTNGGVYRSKDNGANWTRTNNGLPSLDINSVVINSLDHIFIGIKDFGIFRSTNDGDTWVNISDGLADLRVQSLGMSSNDILYVGTGTSEMPTDETESANVFLFTTN